MSNIVTRNWRDLIRPRGIHIEQETLTEFYGRFSCEPLERGYGITLGNSLRRVLLSSLQGAAITAVRIEGDPPCRLGQKLLLGRHIASCVADALRSGSKTDRQRKIDELIDVFSRFGGR